MKRYWLSDVRPIDDFGRSITNQFFDARTRHGPWAIMSTISWTLEGCGKLGTGFGQGYTKQPDGRWLKTEG